MQVTRRWWTLAALAATFAATAAVLQNPLYLGVTLLLAGYLLSTQHAFLRDLTATRNATTVTHSFTPSTALEHTPVDHTATVTLATTPESTVTAVLHPPTTWTTNPTTSTVTDTATLAQSGEFPVAGRFSAPPVDLEFSDPSGLYTETLAVGDQASVTVDPSAPRDAAVFAGGDRIGVGYGDHEAERGSGGLDPGELRQYQPGDPTNRIDWNATARLGDPHVREFTTDTDRDTLLFLDHRSTLTDGPQGRTQFDYLREIALWLVAHARDLGDPLGLYTIGDDGLTTRTPLTTGSDHYRRLEHRLHDLTPTDGTRTRGHRYTSGERHDRAGRLTDDSAFARTLQPYLQHAEAYVERVEDDPLFRTVTTTLDRTTGTPWVVVLTDDTHRAELHETVRAARRRDAPVTAFVSPDALFTPQGLTDADAAYAGYTDFLEYRNTLTGQHTRTYEVAPGDRLDTILTTTP